MIIQDNEPYFYNLILQKQLNYINVCTGSFTIPNHEQIFLATSNSIDIYDITNGKFDHILSIDNIDSTITSVGTINPPNDNHSLQLDKILVLSDSGNITILQFDSINNTLKPIIIEPLIRAGLRRTSPLYRFTIDPSGKFIFMSSFEKFTYMYRIEYTNDDNNITQMKLSSPIGFNKDDTIFSSITLCDTKPYENPIFVTIEHSKNFTDPMASINFYTLDLNLNRILLIETFKLKRESFGIVALPDLIKFGYLKNLNDNNKEEKKSNPFVLLAYENHLLIKDMLGYYTIEIPLPHRNGETEPNTMLSVDIQIIKKNDFIVILQASNGDLLKLQFEKNNSTNVLKASINYFDTLPHADSLHIFPNGYMFVNSEFNDKLLLQFESLGSNKFEIQKTYKIHDKLENLSIIDTLKTLNPLTSTALITSKDNTKTTFLTRSNDKSLRILSSSIKFDDLISSNLPPNPINIWTLKQNPLINYHNLLVLAFENSTTFLQIEGNSIKDLKLPSQNTFILQNDKTIHMNTMIGNTIIQVCSNSCNQISIKQNYKSILNWYPPAGITITKAESTPNQLILALSNNDIIYMEIQSNGEIIESQKKLSMDTKIMDISLYSDPRKPLEPCKFLIVGTDDKLINVISLQHDNDDDGDENFLEVVSFMKLTDIPNSVLYTPGYIHVGLNNGIYSRSKILDSGSKQIATGEIKDVWNKYIGVKKVSLSVIKRTVLSLKSNEEEDEEDQDSIEDIDNERENQVIPCVLVTSDTTWASYQYNDNLYVRPIDFASEIKGLSQVTEITTETLKFNGCCILSKSGKLIIGQFKDFIFNNKWLRMEEIPLSLDDNNTEDKDTNSDSASDSDSDSDDELDSQVDIQKFRNKITLPYNTYTIFIDNSSDDDGCDDIKSARISILDSNMRLLEFVNDDNSKSNFQSFPNIKVITAKLINFTKGGNSNLIISTLDNKLITCEISIKKSYFKIIEIHTTNVDDRVYALCEFDNKVIVPIRNTLVFYSLGKTQLLKKAVHNTLPSTHIVATIDNWEDKRIAVGDIQESVSIYQMHEGEFVAIASDVTKRYVVAAKFIDPYTVMGSDRFGNIWALRVPVRAQNDNTSKIILNNSEKKLSGNLIETPYQLKVLNHYYINDIVMDIFIVHNIHQSGKDCILYTGIQGTFGALIPIISKNEVTLLKKIEDNIADLEMTMTTFLNSDEYDDDFKNLTGINSEELQTMKNEKKKDQFLEGGYSLVGRDHQTYRGYYAPVRNIINGDLCESYQKLSTLEQNLICCKISKHNLARDAIIKALNEVRTGYL